MANLLQVPDSYANQLAELLAIGRQKVPVSTLDSATLVPTWATVLAIGATTGGTSPTIDAADALIFAGASQLVLQNASGMQVTYAGSVRFVVGNNITFRTSTVQWSSAMPTALLNHAGTAGAPMTIQAQEGGGILTLQGGVSNTAGVNGGNYIAEGGACTAAVGAGGTAYLRGGLATAGAASYGEALVQHADYNVAIRVQNGTGHTGGQAIKIDQTGLAFFDGTTVTKPSIVGAKGGNVALTNLLTALANMGLITDNTT